MTDKKPQISLSGIEKEMNRYVRIDDFDKKLVDKIKKYMTENPEQVLVTFSYFQTHIISAHRFYDQSYLPVVRQSTDFACNMYENTLDNLLTAHRRAYEF